MSKIFKGNLEIRSEEDAKKLEGYDGISGDLYIYSQAKLDALKSVGGYLYIHSQAKLDTPNLKSVGGYLSINSQISEKLEKQLWKLASKKKWHITDLSSEWLLRQKGDITYRINNVEFYKDLFDKVRKDQLTAAEVFQLSNTEQRRVAYERMDKTKMKELAGKVLEERTDEQGNKERVVEFSVKGLNNPLKFFNCICPSTGREYFIETDEKKCVKAKSKSFGQEEMKFDEEW